MAVLPPSWVRCRADVDGEWLVASRSDAQPYELPADGLSLVSDLAAIRAAKDARTFARNYGFLWSGPESETFREPLRSWYATAHELDLMLLLSTALRDGDTETVVALLPEARRALSLVISEAEEASIEAATQEALGFSIVHAGKRTYVFGRPQVTVKRKPDRFAEAASILASVVSWRMRTSWHYLAPIGRAPQEQASSAHSSDPSRLAHSTFTIAALPSDLVAYAYHEVAKIVAGGASVVPCPQCGRFFKRKNAKQLYCDKKCSKKMRWHRLVEKAKRQEEQG